MAKLSIQAGTTSKTVKVFIQNSSVTTGAGLTGLAFGTSGLTAYYIREGASSTTAITLATATLGTWATGGFIVADGTNMPGVYELGIPNAAIAASAASVTIYLQGATNMAPCVLEIELTAVNNQSTGFGLVNASSNVVQWNSTNVSSPATAGIPDVNIKNMNNVAATSITTINANQGTTQPTNFSGTGSSAFVKSDTEQLNAQTVTAAAGVTFPSSVASPTNITAGTITTVTNLTNAATSGDLTATMKSSVTTAANAATTVGITSNRKKSATATFEFLMQDATTGAPKTGLTVSSKISKDGGADANTSNSVTEIGLGQYQIILTNTEMTANNIFLQFTATGAITYSLSLQTQP